MPDGERLFRIHKLIGRTTIPAATSSKHLPRPRFHFKK
jgi:hypothetical protein